MSCTTRCRRTQVNDRMNSKLGTRARAALYCVLWVLFRYLAAESEASDSSQQTHIRARKTSSSDAQRLRDMALPDIAMENWGPFATIYARFTIIRMLRSHGPIAYNNKAPIFSTYWILNINISLLHWCFVYCSVRLASSAEMRTELELDPSHREQVTVEITRGFAVFMYANRCVRVIPNNGTHCLWFTQQTKPHTSIGTGIYYVDLLFKFIWCLQQVNEMEKL